jgi:hypothetical protein
VYWDFPDPITDTPAVLISHVWPGPRDASGVAIRHHVLGTFQTIAYHPAMPDTPDLRPTPDEIAETLAFALRYRGRKRVFDADHTMARITADRLVQHLERSGFV